MVVMRIKRHAAVSKIKYQLYTHHRNDPKYSYVQNCGELWGSLSAARVMLRRARWSSLQVLCATAVRTRFVRRRESGPAPRPGRTPPTLLPARLAPPPTWDNFPTSVVTIKGRRSKDQKPGVGIGPAANHPCGLGCPFPARGRALSSP